MNRVKFPYFSFGTLYGTIWDYDNEGNNTGSLKNISGFPGIFFAVHERFGRNDNNPPIIFKSMGAGVSLVSGSYPVITFQAKDLDILQKEYAYSVYISPTGSVYVEGTTEMKAIGSGIFEVTKGVKYGT